VISVDPFAVSVDPSDKFLYVQSSGNVSVFTIDPVNGTPAKVADQPFTAGPLSFAY
jgi:DNA-binding beta-propeller fold protein YncE